MRHITNAAAIATVSLLASVVPAGAQLLPQSNAVNWAGPYGGVSLGADWGHLPGKVSTPGNATTPGSTVGLRGGDDTTVIGGGQIGYNWQLWNNWVFGVEGDIRGGGPSHTTGAPAGTANFPAGSSFNASSDWNGSIRGRIGYAWDQFLFYGTGGIAFADASLKANYPATAAAPASTASHEGTLIGPTVGGGIEYALSPNISIGGEYRYTDYDHNSFSLGSATTAAGSMPTNARLALRDNTAMFKVNYRFSPPPPPPPMPAAAPAPVPQAPRVFIVFFDWDKDTITPEGHQIIQQAADAYKSGAPVQIQVTGYTDRSGSASYNQRLSERRANNVAKALAALGVPQNQMVVSGRGENDNRVPTADGVREPQNRRVEITAP